MYWQLERSTTKPPCSLDLTNFKHASPCPLGTKTTAFDEDYQQPNNDSQITAQITADPRVASCTTGLAIGKRSTSFHTAGAASQKDGTRLNGQTTDGSSCPATTSKLAYPVCTAVQRLVTDTTTTSVEERPTISLTPREPSNRTRAGMPGFPTNV